MRPQTSGVSYGAVGCTAVPHAAEASCVCADVHPAECRSYLFTMGCFLLSVEAMNRDFPVELAQWKAGQRPVKPRFRCLW